MDLFSIACTTCKSRLKVREESAIGQILACPQCGGMVMVNPPPGWKKGEPMPAAASPQSSSALPITTVVEMRRPDETLGDSNFDAVDDLLSEAPPRIRTPSPVSVAADAPGLARPRFLGAPPPATSLAAPPAPPAGTSAQPAGATPTKPLAAPGAGANLSGQQSGSGNGKANAAAAITSPAIPTTQPAGKPSAKPAVNETAQLAANATQPAAPAEALMPPPPGEANDADPLPPPDWSPQRPWRYWAMMGGSVIAGIVLALGVVVGMIRFFKDDTQTIAQAGPTPQQPASPGTATRPTSSNPSGLPSTKPPASVPATPVATTPMPAVEPMPPAPMPPAPMPPMPAVEPDLIGPADPPQPPVKPANPNDPLAKFDRLISGDEAPAASTETPATAPMPAPEPPPAAADKPVLPRPAPRSVNITARLADPLPGIETSGTPLADFLQFFQDLSTIPISLTPDGLPLARATAETPVVLTGESAKNTTVNAALAAGLKPLGLEYVVEEDQLVVRLIEPTPLPTLNYPIKDLAAGEPQMAELAEMLQTLIEPASWNTAGGEGTLTVDAARGLLTIQQRRAVHAQLLVACEKLRTARKLTYKTTLGPALFQLDTRLARAQARLETPISLNFSQPTPLVRILDRLGQAGGVRILVDWRDVAAAGWNPDGEATLIADKQPLGAALGALLGPMDLTWRVVDGRTIQVVTPGTLAAHNDLEFYKVDGLTADDATGQALVAKIQAGLGQGLFRDSGGPGHLHYDPSGQCLLASLPQPRQRELETLLAKWRSELPRP